MDAPWDKIPKNVCTNCVVYSTSYLFYTLAYLINALICQNALVHRITFHFLILYMKM